LRMVVACVGLDLAGAAPAGEGVRVLPLEPTAERLDASLRCLAVELAHILHKPPYPPKVERRHGTEQLLAFDDSCGVGDGKVEDNPRPEGVAQPRLSSGGGRGAT